MLSEVDNINDVVSTMLAAAPKLMHIFASRIASNQVCWLFLRHVVNTNLLVINASLSYS